MFILTKILKKQLKKCAIVVSVLTQMVDNILKAGKMKKNRVKQSNFKP